MTLKFYKKVRKFTVLMLVMLLLFSANNVCFVVAASISENFNGKSDEETNAQIFTMTGSDVPIIMKNKIEDAGVLITDDTVIELVPVSVSNGENLNSALVITNMNSGIIMKDVLIMVSDEDVGFVKENDICTYAGTTVDFPALSWDGRYMIHGTAVYNQYSYNFVDCYYQPIGAYFTYQKYETCTVSNISMLYICDGCEYSYPEFKNLSLSEFSYVITVEKSSPDVSTIYSTTEQYNTNRVIHTGSGVGAGQFITFNVVVDGKADGYTVKL